MQTTTLSLFLASPGVEGAVLALAVNVKADGLGILGLATALSLDCKSFFLRGVAPSIALTTLRFGVEGDMTAPLTLGFSSSEVSTSPRLDGVEGTDSRVRFNDVRERVGVTGGGIVHSGMGGGSPTACARDGDDGDRLSFDGDSVVPMYSWGRGKVCAVASKSCLLPAYVSLSS